MKGTVKQVKTKQVANGNLYNVQIESNGKTWWYSTFDDTAAEIDGKPIEFEYKKVEKNGKEFYNLTEFKIAQSNGNTNGNGSQSNGKSDCWINAVALIKSGLEGGIIKDMDEARREFMNTYIFLGHVWAGDKEKAKKYIGELKPSEEFEDTGEEVGAEDVPF